MFTMLVTGLIFIGCAKNDSPTSAHESDLNQIMSLENNGGNVNDLLGTWTLDAVYFGDKNIEICDLTYTFIDDGTGSFNKMGNVFDYEWTINENVLEFAFDEKIMKMYFDVSDVELYLVWGEFEHKGKF